MANSASDARGSEQEIRRKLIESGVVDVIVAVGTNMFYTVTLPVTLWFLDKGKSGKPHAEKVLFIDARQIFRQIDRATRDWTPAQIGFLANVVRLYRGEDLDYTFGGAEARQKIGEIFGTRGYRDVLGLCKVATLKEIEAHGWGLNCGSYVGVAPGEQISEDDFKEQFASIAFEFTELCALARRLEEKIARDVSIVMGT